MHRRKVHRGDRLAIAQPGGGNGVSSRNRKDVCIQTTIKRNIPPDLPAKSPLRKRALPLLRSACVVPRPNSPYQLCPTGREYRLALFYPRSSAGKSHRKRMWAEWLGFGRWCAVLFGLRWRNRAR